MPTTLPQYDEETDLKESSGYQISGFTLSEASEALIYGTGALPSWSLSWVNSDTTATALTTDDCGYMATWEFIVWVWYSGQATDTLGEDAIGISVDLDDPDYTFYSTVAGDNIEDASFSSLAFNVDGITFTGDVALGDSETEALGEIYNPSSDLAAAIDSYVAGVAASSIGTIEPAHTFKKIETPEIDDETFDVFEGEEGAQAVTVSTTYTY